MRGLDGVEVGMHLGVFDVKGIWKPDETQKKAAWEMYVELATRISVANSGDDEGLVSESLISLYSLFDTTRDIMRRYGPGVAQKHGDSDLSFGYLAVAILNGVLRPVLTKWHPLLSDYESRRALDVSKVEYERAWDREKELRQALNNVRATLIEYGNVLAKVADVPCLTL